MKHNINVIKSVWRRLRKPSPATLDAIGSQKLQNPLDSAVWQHIARLEADRRALLTMAKAVVDLRDMNVHPRPSSEIIHALRYTISRVESGKSRENQVARRDLVKRHPELYQ
jgi:hypothetical protein